MLFEHLKLKYKLHSLSSILDVPILILLYFLGYMTGFTICLTLMIINAIGFVIWSTKEKKKLGLE